MKMLRFLVILFAALLFAVPALASAQEGDACADAVDNDGDTFVNDGCPPVGEPEAPVVTEAPTDEPTAAPTDEPTAAPTATPDELPPTGGQESPTATPDPDPDPGDDDPGDGDDPSIVEWVSETFGLSMFLQALMIFFGAIGINKLDKKTRKIINVGLVLGLTVIATTLYVSEQGQLQADSLADYWGTFALIFGESAAIFVVISSNVRQLFQQE